MQDQPDHADQAAGSDASAKQALWEHTRAAVEHITDGLGKGIDEGIKETVTVLQVLGMHTCQFCEGHLDWGEAAPWIELCSPDADALTPKINALLEQIEALERELKQYRTEQQAAEAKELKQLLPFLDAFYRDREVPYEQRLIMAGMRLTSQGVELQAAEPDGVKAQKLRDYQEEMRAFTAFVKQQFFVD
jgi:hypothetical protein